MPDPKHPDDADPLDLGRLHEELRASEERFRTLIRDLHVGVIVHGPSAEILVANPKALELLGLSGDQLLGMTSYDPSWRIVREDETPFPPEDRPVGRVLATRQAARNVVIGVDRPTRGDRVWLLINAEPEFKSDGTVRQIVATLGDITERKRLEASLLSSQKLESIGRLAGGVAHDFNNLLTVIVGSTSLALRSLPADAPARRELALGLDAAERAANLTRQLLTFARRQVSTPQTLHLPAVLADVGLLLGRLLGPAVRLRVEAPSDTWLVRVDPVQLEQLVVNLAVNARDAMPEGGTITIATSNVCTSEEGDLGAKEHVVLCVSDTGAGIDPSAKAHLFEPFFTTKDVGKGTGLGLATVDGIARSHGGFVKVESTPTGASFRVYLPRASAVPAASAIPAASRAPVAPSDKRTILLAEDEPGLLTIATRILEGRGYTVLAACDGKAALALAASHPGPIALLVTDLVMPGMDGRALAAAFRALRPATPVLFVSGFADGRLEGTGERFLPKPYAPDTLARAVFDALADA